MQNILHTKSGCPECGKRSTAKARNDAARVRFEQGMTKRPQLEALDSYVDQLTPIGFKCLDCSSVFFARPMFVVDGNTKCQCKHIKKSFSPAVEQEFRKACRERKLKILSEYQGVVKKVLLECPKGHQWKTSPWVVKDMKCGCPECARFKSLTTKIVKVSGKTFAVQGYEDLALDWLVHEKGVKINSISNGRCSIPSFLYDHKNVTRTYYPDFQVGKRHIIEVKSVWTAGLLKHPKGRHWFSQLQAKAQAVKDEGYFFHLLLLGYNSESGEAMKANLPLEWETMSKAKFKENLKWTTI